MDLPTWSAGTSTLTITWEPGFFSVSTLTAMLAITLTPCLDGPPPQRNGRVGVRLMHRRRRRELAQRLAGELDRVLVLHVGHVENQAVESGIEKRLGPLGHPVRRTHQVVSDPLGIGARDLEPSLQRALRFRLRIANDQRPESRLDDGIGVAANRLAMLLQDVDLVADRLRIAEEVAHVRVLGHQLQGPPLAAAADH